MTQENFEQAEKIKMNILEMENIILKIGNTRIKNITLKDGSEINYLCRGKIKEMMLEHCEKRKNELMERFNKI